MTKEKILILDEERIKWKLQRMAFEIWEHNSNEKAVTLVGIDGKGVALANCLATQLKSISPLKVSVANIKMNKKQPLKGEIKLSEDLSGHSLILVDDVANSGKTLAYALRPLLDVDAKKIMIAVLVDRKHKSYPVSPDIVGHSVSTTMQEHIEVETDGDVISGAYLV